MKVFLVDDGVDKKLFREETDALKFLEDYKEVHQRCRKFYIDDKYNFEDLMETSYENFWSDKTVYDKKRASLLARHGLTEEILAKFSSTNQLYVEELEIL